MITPSSQALLDVGFSALFKNTNDTFLIMHHTYMYTVRIILPGYDIKLLNSIYSKVYRRECV